ncbi:MAG: corrinoid protein [Candidatus Freyarchaeota archaeon]|nr:corrinoid protein [Candidatus Jordarchaeia archaeon]
MILEKLKEAIVNLDINGVKEACREAIDAGIPAYKCVSEGMAKGLDIVGEKYEKGEYFLADLVVAGEAMKEGMKVLEPYLRAGEAEALGRVVIGTVRGDMHDIGKNIVATMLSGAGFKVIDLGVDVPPERFVEAVRKHRPHIVGMSALLTTTMMEMEKVIRALEDAGLRSRVKVIIGGAPVSMDYAEKIGADAYARDAVEGVSICKSWISEER